jgi:RHS repeat-associated protein
MLNRLLNLAAALLLACASTGVHGYARPLQPETAHRGFATAAQGAHRDQANVTPEAASENSPTSVEPPDGRRFYAKARYYGAGRGSFLSVDPWDGNTTSPVSLNKYLYGYANPGVYVDPDGRCVGPFIIPCAAAIATGGTYAIEYVRAAWFGTPEEQQNPAAAATASTAYALETNLTAAAGAALVVQTGGTAAPLVAGLMQGGRTGLNVALMQNAPRVAATADDVAYTLVAATGANTPSLTAPLALPTAQAIDAAVEAARPVIRYGDEATRIATHSDVPAAPTARGESQPLQISEGLSGQPVAEPSKSAASLVTWVDEGGNLREGGNPGMRKDAYDFQSSAPGARSSFLSGRSQAPYLQFVDENGSVVGAKFDGVSDSELIDRKMNPVFSAKAVDQARRQLAVANHFGLTPVWEMKSPAAVSAAERFMNANELQGFTVRLAPE